MDKNLYLWLSLSFFVSCGSEFTLSCQVKYLEAQVTFLPLTPFPQQGIQLPEGGFLDGLRIANGLVKRPLVDVKVGLGGEKKGSLKLLGLGEKDEEPSA